MRTSVGTVSRRSLLRAAALGGGALALASAGVAFGGAEPARPWTIPALREWTGAAGGFRLGAAARILVRATDADRLSSAAALLAADLKALTGVPVAVVVSGAKPKPGDVALRLGAADAQLGGEGYRLAIGDAVTITGNAAAGVFHGGRSLLQLLTQSDTVPAGTARDWPRYAERGLMIDTGRRHYDYDWLAARIREMAYLKLNLLHLHFTENTGWRIASDGHPEIVSEQHLTKQQVRDLIALAARHHITVIPEIDMPGHMGAALAAHPELQLTDIFGRRNPNNLDFTLPAARQYARELVEEYLPLFPGGAWHTGADEYLALIPPAATPIDYTLYPQLERYAKQTYGPEAVAKDAVLGFVNDIHALVAGHGRTLRAWADGMGGGKAVTVDREVVAEWWTDTGGPGVAELFGNGHRIHNCSWYPTYYSIGPYGVLPPRPDLEGMYETWATQRFRGPLYLNGDWGGPWYDIPADSPANLGAKLHIWNDDPSYEDPATTAAGIFPRLRILSQQTWESTPLVTTYAEFAPIIERVGAAPR